MSKALPTADPITSLYDRIEETKKTEFASVHRQVLKNQITIMQSQVEILKLLKLQITDTNEST